MSKPAKKRSFWFHFGIVVSLCAVLYAGFFTALHWLTKHGEELKIPDVSGKRVDSAVAQLKGMHFDVFVDSTYEPSLKPLTVLKQMPDTGSIVKEGRTVFLTVNMVTPPHIPMPSLVNLSFRSAELILHNSKLILGDTTYKPDIAAGAILEQLYNGAPIRAGESIPQGSKISLVIGDGMGNNEFLVPDVTGLDVDNALAVLNQYNLFPVYIAGANSSAITDTSAATIIDQYPHAMSDAGAANHIKEGSIINLTIEQK